MRNTNHKELAPRRLERLRQLVRHSRIVSVNEICKQLGVSAATARRELQELKDSGEVRRVHELHSESLAQRDERDLVRDVVVERRQDHVAALERDGRQRA